MAASTKKPSGRKPATLFKSSQSLIKYVFRKKITSKGIDMSLKAFVRNEALSDFDFLKAAQEWMHNKRANTKVPELCIGKTRRKKGDKGKAKTPEAGAKKR